MDSMMSQEPEDPSAVHLSKAAPCQGVLFTRCHICRPASHDEMVLLLTVPAPWVVMKVARRSSDAGMRLISGMLKSSQNFVNQTRPVT